ncbi:MAG: prolyl oligopeptidase family serine peptidase [Xanthomonadales bacterium]|nr:prolyl oligopeptidase family serine peptidase [Xanthomonadales bacterium]
MNTRITRRLPLLPKLPHLMKLRILTLCLLAIGLLVCGGSAAEVATAKSVIIQQSPYEFPFESYDEWLDFMDQSPDQSWHRAALEPLVSRAAFTRYQHHETVITQRMSYRSDGLEIKGLIVQPRHPKGPLPVVLYAHGGVAQWGRITFFDILELQRLAEQGYLVLASSFRGEGGSEGQANLGDGERRDLLQLLAVAKELPHANLNKVGLWGFSRGGGLTYRALAKHRDFSAAIAVGARSDFLNSPRRAEFDEHVYPFVIPNYAADKDAALTALSALYWAEDMAPQTPLLMIHGNRDTRVQAVQSLKLAQVLQELQRPFELLVINNGSHTLIEHQQQLRAAIDAWFGEHLQGDRT